MTPGGAASGESRPIWRRVLRVALIGTGVIAGLLAGFIVALQFDAFGTWLARTVARSAVPATIDVSIDRVSGSWVRSLNVVGLRLSDARGETVVSLDTLHARYRLLPLLRRRIDVRSATVAAPRVRLARRADGSIGIESFPAPGPTEPAASAGGGWRFSLGSLDVADAAGRLTTPLDTVASGAPAGTASPALAGREVVLEWQRVHLALRDLRTGDDLTLTIDSATGRVDVPTLPPEAGVGPLDFRAAASMARGRIEVGTLDVTGPATRVAGAGNLALPDSTGQPIAVDFDLDVDSLPLAIVHVSLGNEPDASARLNATVDVGGTTAMLSATLDAGTSDGGRVAGTAAFAPAGNGDVAMRADLEIAGLDPATLTGDSALAGAIEGSLDVELAGPVMASLSGHARASFDRFAIGPAALRSARLESTWTAGRATIDANLEGDAVAAGISGTISPLDAAPDYDLRGPFRLRIPGDSADLAVLAGTFDVSGKGFAPDSAKVDVDVSLSRIALMSATLESGRIAAHLDSGRVAFSLEARARDTGRVGADGSVTLGEEIGFRIDRATVRDFDVAALLGDSLPSRLDADFTASGVVGQPEGIRSDLRLAIRDARFGPLSIDTALVDARLAGGALRATGRTRANAGRADFAVTARPFGDVPIYAIERLRLSDVDLGALTTETRLSTQITGTITGGGSGASLERLALDLSFVLDSSRVNGQTLADGEAVVALRDGRADIGASIAFADSGGIRVDLTGRPFALRPTFEVGEIEFRALDPFAFTGGTGAVRGMSASLNGTAAATIDGLDPRTMATNGTLRLDASRINREPVREGRIEWTLREARLEADADVEFEAGRFSANGRVGFGDADVSYVLNAVLRSDRPGRLAGMDSLGGSVDATFSVDGRGTSLASMSTRVRAVADSAVFGDIRVDTMRLAVRIEDGIASIDTLTVRSNFASVTGGGSMPVSDSAAAVPVDLTIEATIHSLDPARRWIGIDPIGLGTGDLRVAVTGSADSVRFDAMATASAVLLGTTRLIGLQSTVGGRLERLRLASATGHLELDQLDMAGFEIRVSSLDGQWNGDELTLDGDATIDDRRSVVFEMRVDPRPGTARADLERFDFSVDQDVWRLDGTPAVSWADGIRIDSLTLRAGDQILAVDGLFDTAGRSDLSARIERFRIGSIADLLGYERLDGTLTGSFGLRGSAADPRMTGGIDARLEWRGGMESSVVATLTYDTLRLGLDASIRTDRGGALTVTGGLPIDLALTRTAEGDTTQLTSSAPGEVDLTVRADSFSVEWIEPFLDPMTARGFDGRLQIDARVTGSQANPLLSGFVRLSNGRLTVPRLGVTYEDAAMRVSLDGNVATIDSASARAGDGTITLGGTVSMPELSLGEFDIDARLDRFRAIHTDAYRIRASGTAGISGTTREPRLHGSVRLVETDIYLGDRVSGASVRPVELTEEQIRELQEYFGLPIRPPARDPNALFEVLTIDLDVSMSRDTWVRQRANPELEIQLTGDVQVTKQPQDSLRFDGRVEAVARRSYVEQFGKRFRIEQGIVELQGRASEARIDIRAVYTVPSVRDPSLPEATITLDVGGTLDDLSLQLGSEPQMENADIISYLATGRPAATSLDFSDGGGGGGGIGSIGSDLALGQVTGLVEGLAAEGVGLDVVEIQADGLRGATLIAGRFITPRVYVGFKQPIGRDPDNPDAASEFERTEVEIEYQALRWLLLNMEASNSAISFVLRYRHAY